MVNWASDFNQSLAGAIATSRRSPTTCQLTIWHFCDRFVSYYLLAYFWLVLNFKTWLKIRCLAVAMPNKYYILA